MRRLLPVLVAVLLVAVRQASGDAIVLSQAMKASTIMEAYLEEDSLRVELEVGAAEVGAFADLLPGTDAAVL